MQLVLTEDQELLAKTAADFAAEHCPVARVRALRDAGDAAGFTPSLWKQMAELGWVGILLPEEHGGAEMGVSELAVVLEALGRTLTPEPFLSTVLLGGEVVARAGSAAQRKAWLPGIAEGDRHVTLAAREARDRAELGRVATRAEGEGDGWRIRGEKTPVLEAPTADAFVVAARTGGAEGDREGVSLFLVPADAEGVRVTPQTRIDGRGAGMVRFDGVSVGADALLGEVGGGAAVLEPVLDRAAVGLAAEMLGAMSEAFDRTLSYLKDRDQFGVPIGSFQALKHRAARLYMEIELARSAVMAAARACDAGAPDAALLASLAKARCSDSFLHVADEAVQMHGGIGMTDEHEIGFYMKRARVAAHTLGDAAWHRDRWASLSGY